MNKKPAISRRTALQRDELKVQNEAVKTSRAFNSNISSLTIIAKGVDKNTRKKVSHIFDYNKAAEIPSEFYEFLNAYGASCIAKREMIRHELKQMNAKFSS